jgi:Lipopolysaccharide kinase (Kdo/WaaP) family
MPVRPLIIFESPTTEATLRQNGLGTLDAIFERRAAAHVRHVGRAVWKTDLVGEDDQSFTAFVKLSWGRRRWWPRLSDIRTGQVLQSLAVREWEGLKNFERLGLQVPERLALLEEGVLWKRSALILKAVPPPASVSDLILDGGWLQLPVEDRQLILAEIARTLCRIHGAGWAW